ncbi:hypothetical protein GCM10009001_00590 [Virgibacillus siamensis]|uniref:Uncharacterized protein n=1 Tax=Virgibacillus siamensis TaxID=480071 RepID=A0ABN1FDG9_9BACI
MIKPWTNIWKVRQRRHQDQQKDQQKPKDKKPDLQGKTVLKNIKLPFLKMNERWEVGYSKLGKERLIFEFVHNGETVQNWIELITVQYFSYKTTLFSSSKKYAEALMQYLNKQVKNGNGNMKVNYLQASKQETFFEFMVTDAKGWNDQHELERLFLGEDGIWILHYVIKDEFPMNEKRRKKWFEILKNVEVQSDFRKLELI